MLWAVHCLDADDVLEIRQEARAEHSAGLRSGIVEPVFYGMLTSDDGDRPVGSLILMRAEDRETVERYVAQDPFMVKGVWRQVTVTAFAESSNSPAQLTDTSS
ncbi:YciI family protein [Streptomyces sp. NPDC052040]|uniref:YciI family protein n=1 Tax=unclassified Streptomyces TaxID=2593676 RepID=UPI0037D70579